SVSAIQIAAAATVFANGGVLLKPNIVKKIVSPEGRIVKEFGREPVRNVISQETARSMLVMMERATEEGGTAWRALPNGVRMSSKTGTAQVPDPKTGTYSKDKFIASCISLFPSDDPEFIVYLVIENPKTSSIFGSRIAAPLVRDIAEQIINYRGIARSMDTMIEHSGTVIVPERKPIQLTDVVPDLTGTPKIDLLPLLEEKDITVIIEGEGWVVKQSPPPGTPLRQGMVLHLELR
ncbi:MAG TPA: penicillin-binding transpeptidase domain-containing protein, partial [Spirochaetia bacterium]|nr:penicillin-binding transpeptidase domain-containing protein [Spirochaetia bacterium]